MSNFQGKYALVQYCPVPERQEFVNLGLMLFVPEINFFEVKFAKGQSRVERLFGKQSKAHIEALKASFRSRLIGQFRYDPVGKSLDEFAARRANEMRLSPVQPVLVKDPGEDLAALFEELVGNQEPAQREPQIRRRLRDAFVRHNIEPLLDKPDEIELAEYDITVNVPYGYQNGCYNLIDGMRLPAQTMDGLREAGKRAMEGSLIWKHFEGGARKRLVVVGDFSKQTDGFYHAVSEQFEQANVRLHRLDDLRPLFDDIEKQAEAHGRHSLA